MTDRKAELVIDVAKTFIELIQQIQPEWKSAYFRFRSEPHKYGSNASYTTDNGVFILDVIKYRAFFKEINQIALELAGLLGKEQVVMLLTIDASLKYKIHFEYENLDRWVITKLDGHTGVPEGIPE